jgi:hypothetical protein
MSGDDTARLERLRHLARAAGLRADDERLPRLADQLEALRGGLARARPLITPGTEPATTFDLDKEAHDVG